MDEMNDKINAILNDPNMMQQIMSMANALGSNKETPRQEQPLLPDIDVSTLQRLTGLAMQCSIDKREPALLRALGAYLSKDRLYKLEKAMRAAKMAKFASTALSQRGLLNPAGR